MHRTERLSRSALLGITFTSLSCFAEAAGTATPDNPAGTSAPRQPVEYIAREKSLVGNEMYEAGQRVSYAGLPAENLQPTCDIGRARFQEYLESNKDRVAKMISDNKEGSENGIGNANAFMTALLKQREEDRKDLAEQLARQSEQMQHQSQMQAEAIGTAVAQAMANAFAMFFPNGLPSAVPADPAAQEALGATPGAPAADIKSDQSVNTGSGGDAGAATPAKRTK